MFVALNWLDVMAANIMSAYISLLHQRKELDHSLSTLRSKLGRDRGKEAIIVRDCKGLKSAGQSFREHLAYCMCFRLQVMHIHSRPLGQGLHQEIR